MLAIRFNRTGKRNHASFRVVLQEHTKAPGKRHVEILGSYDPHKKTTILKKERILYWISQGAQASPVVTNLLVREGVIQGKKIAKKMPRPVAKEEAKTEESVAPAVEEPTVAEALAGEGVKTEEVSAPVAEEAKKEETSVSADVQSEIPEEKVEEVAPVVEASVGSVPPPVAVEEVSAPAEIAPKV